MKYRYYEDRCPICGSVMLDYDAIELHDEAVAYPTTCRSCGASWLQWYSLVYCSNTDVMDKDGNVID